MDQCQRLKADNLRVSFIQVLPNLKSCQGMEPNAPTGYTIYCLMFLCLWVSAPGICWYTQWGMAGERGSAGRAKERRQGACSQRWLTLDTEQSLVPSGAAHICFPPGCLCCNVAWTWGGRSGRNGGCIPWALSPSSGPAPPFFPSIPQSNSYPPYLFWMHDLMPFQQRNIDILVCRQQGVLD